MAIRYLMSVGMNGRQPGQIPQLALRDLPLVHRTDNLAVYANEPGIVLAGNRGMLLGHVFSTSQQQSVTGALSADLTAAITETHGQRLLTDFWGGYVAVISGDKSPWLVRDPSGLLPCYYVCTEDGYLVASDVELLFNALPRSLVVDWYALGRHLISADARRPETCLSGVKELLAGHSLELSVTETQKALWSPWDYVDARKETDPETTARLRTILDETLNTWGTCFKSIGVSLSGGLDSSIVTAGLRDHSGKLTLLNLAGDDAESDERAYAQLAADAVGSQIIFGHYDARNVDFQRSTSIFLPRPVYGTLAQADLRVKSQIAEASGLDAWFGGLGGDNVFCIMQSATPVLDRLRAEGLGKGALETLRDVMDLTGCSIWQAVRQIQHTRRTFSGRYTIQSDLSLLNPDYAESVDLPFQHPWLEAPEGTPVGKIVHVALLLRIQAGNDGYDRRGPPLISPLLSQPILETCLSIPSWQWCAGGQNRAMARRAFHGILPDRLLDRRSKGGPSRFSYRTIDANKRVLRDLLLNGVLAGHQVLDRPLIEAQLNGDGPISNALYVRLAQLAEAENWARSWQ